MSVEKPLVSVIICVYNAGGYLRSAVESVLNQTYPNLEILIIDDGSTDGCMEAIKDLADPRIRIILQGKNQGKPTAMNVALQAMHGAFYILNDADDLSAPNRIECQLQCMLDNPDVAAVYCGYNLIMGDRQLAPLMISKDRERCRKDIAAFRMPSHDPTGMYRVSLVGQERYNVSLLLGEGLDYILRIGERHPMMVVGQSLYTYRIHPQSITKRSPELRDRLVQEVLKQACERRGLDFQSQFPTKHPVAKNRNRDFDNNIAAHFMDSVCSLRLAGKRVDAVRTGLVCVKFHPLDLHYYKALIYSIAPMWLVRKLRKVSV